MLFRLPVTLLFLLCSCFATASAAGGERGASGKGKTEFVLAASWQPAFCEGRKQVPECVTQTTARPDATRFSLHGLWKVRQSYCGVADEVKVLDKAREWARLPPVKLEPALAAKLSELMPGTQSSLDRHEWIKHGSCSGLDQAGYFGMSLNLLEELNASAVGRLFASNIGKTLDEARIKAAFDETFGKGAGERVKMSCRKDGERRIISELTLGLGGRHDVTAPLRERLAAARPTKFGCPEGEVDAAGFQ